MQKVSCFDEQNAAEDEKSCFHIRFDNPSGYGEKLKWLQLHVCQSFGKHFFFFFFFFLLTSLLVQKIQNLIKRTKPYKTGVSFLCQYI